MFDFIFTPSHKIEFKVDSSIYSDEVISKVLYWLSSRFVVERESISSQITRIALTSKDKRNFNELEANKIESDISQLFVDFKVREMIRKETDGIRNILYLKAFANCTDLEDLRGDE